MHYQDGQDRNQMFVISMEEMVAADSCLSRLSVTMREARIVDLFGNARFPQLGGMEVCGTSKQVNHYSGWASMPLEDFGFKNMELNKEDSRSMPKAQGPLDLEVSEPQQRMGEPYHPSDLFKLVLYGYRKRIRSSLKWNIIEMEERVKASSGGQV